MTTKLISRHAETHNIQNDVTILIEINQLKLIKSLVTRQTSTMPNQQQTQSKITLMTHNMENHDRAYVEI